MGFPPFLPACNPFQPWDPNPIPGSASPAVTHPLHWIPVPPPPALAKFSSSSLNSTGIFWGVPASSHPLGACRLQKCQWLFWGVSPEVVSVWGGHPAPTTLSVPRQDEQSPGTPRRGFGQEGAERGAGQRGEREGRETGGGGLPCLLPWAQPAPQLLCAGLLGMLCSTRGRFAPTAPLCFSGARQGRAGAGCAPWGQ